ncbi:MAG: TrmB family transcriptional regulator [Candidatus Pacearchaeota archaeon]
MIVKEEFLSRLRKIFGLNLYEVRVWTALLSRGVSTAGELADISGVPRSRTYDILESLEKKGIIVMKLGKPIKFVALKPEEVVERVKRNVVRDAQDMSKRLEELKGSDVLEELTALHTTGIKYIEPTDLSGAIRGRNNIYNHLDMMVRNANKIVTIATTAEGLTRKFEALKTAIEKAKKRGVSVRIAAPVTSKNYQVARELNKIAEVRSGKIKSRFTIIDGKELMFLILDDEEVHPNYDVGVWVNSPFFAGALEQIFEHSWDKMTPLSKVKI